ncbi:MAG TPA: hypothetical protein V6C65_32680, partial [Allocoleopsis sp.]
MSDPLKDLEELLDFKKFEELFRSAPFDQFWEFVRDLDEQLDPGSFGFDARVHSSSDRPNSEANRPPAATATTDAPNDVIITPPPKSSSPLRDV